MQPVPAGRRKKGEAEALGRSQRGFSTKLHVRAEGGGRPFWFALTAGQRHESIAFETLMETGAVRRPGPGGPRVLPDAVVADKGYSYPRIRRYLKRKRVRAVISSRSDQVRPKGFSRKLYRQRNLVEHLIGRLKQYRRVATRYEKRGQCYLAMVLLAAIGLWL